MDQLDCNPFALLETAAIKFIDLLEDDTNHPEVWNAIADIASKQNKQILTQFTRYFSQLLTVPQNPQAHQIISTLEAVCLAHMGETEKAKEKILQLKHQLPYSLLIQGAFEHIYQLGDTKPNKSESTELILKVLFDFISAQNKINQAIINKMQNIENTVFANSVNLRNQLHDINQSINLIAKRTTNRQSKKIRCVFIVSFLQSWNTLADVYDVMRASDDFEPIVISTARKYIKNTQTIFGEELVHDFLESENIPHIRLNTALPDHNAMDILKALNPDLIFRQSPWVDLPPVFNPAEINFARLCYIPYSFSAVKKVDQAEPANLNASVRHTDLYYHRLCWRIFCETEMHKDMYVETSVRGGDNVVVTGYPKFDRLISAKQRPEFWPIKDTVTGRKRFRIIWAPHHSIRHDVLAFGTFIEVHQEMLEWAKNSENEYEFVFKPHPGLMGEIVNNTQAFTQEYMDTYLSNWNALPNTAIYEGGDYGPLFVGSDLMLTDGVGFLSEYQLFEKPLVFIDSGRHFGFNAAGTVMMESAHHVKSIAQAYLICERLRNGEPDPLQSVQQTVLPRIMPYPGLSAQKIVQSIREGLAAEGVV